MLDGFHVVLSCDNDKKPSGPVKDGEFSELVLEEEFTPWN
jgi:hypothetical protein